MTKKTKLPSKLLDNFASCHAAAFKLHRVLLFFLLIENVGSYDSLLLYCGGGASKSVQKSYIFRVAVKVVTTKEL